MPKMLITGGTVFVSRYCAEYYVKKGYDVHVLNLNTKEQAKGVTLIEADRHDLGDILREYNFDVVIDTAYTSNDVELLLGALGNYKDYILISSSAVYPEYAPQPLKENTPLSVNKYWGKYGTDKIEAEATLHKKNPNAYILRPPYLYGPMNNVYREAFVFDCALADRVFYLPENSELKLQFFHVHDLCRFIDIVLSRRPAQRVFNVGNRDTISIREWIKLCYEVTGKKVEFQSVCKDIEQRSYFCFYDYEYTLDVSEQSRFMQETIPLKAGLQEALNWYMNNSGKVNKKAYMDYIDKYLV